MIPHPLGGIQPEAVQEKAREATADSARRPAWERRVSNGDSLMELAETVEAEELGSGRPGPTIALPDDDVAAVSREFADRGWSDGLPDHPPDRGPRRRDARRHPPRPP